MNASSRVRHVPSLDWVHLNNASRSELFRVWMIRVRACGKLRAASFSDDAARLLARQKPVGRFVTCSRLHPNKFGSILEMHCVEVVPFPAPDKAMLLKDSNDLLWDLVSISESRL